VQVTTFEFMVIDPLLVLLVLGGLALLAGGLILATRRPSAGRSAVVVGLILLAVAVVWALIATWLASPVPQAQ
jgi:ammonia channel protein AmtB